MGCRGVCVCLCVCVPRLYNQQWQQQRQQTQRRHFTHTRQLLSRSFLNFFDAFRLHRRKGPGPGRGGCEGGRVARSPATFDGDSFAFVVVVDAFFRPLSVYAAFLSLCTLLSVFCFCFTFYCRRIFSFSFFFLCIFFYEVPSAKMPC